MEAYFTWYPNGAPAMSKYLLNKFLYTVDRDPALVERYRERPARHGRLVGGRARQRPAQLPHRRGEHLAALHRRGARGAGHPRPRPALFELGAHPFLTLTLFIAMFERDHDEPLGYQKQYGARLAHFALPYPDIAT